MLNSTQKLGLMRKFDRSPSQAFLDAIELIQRDVQNQSDIKLKEMAKVYEAELIALVDNKKNEIQGLVDDKLKKAESDLLDPLNNRVVRNLIRSAMEDLRGEDGDDASPEEVAGVLLANNEFLTSVKGNPPSKDELVAIIKPLIPKFDQDEIIRTVYSFIPLPKDGKPGADGSPDTPEQIAKKLNSTSKSVGMHVIDGLAETVEKLYKTIRERRGGARSGGMGNVQHEEFSTTSATTSVTTVYDIAGNGTALWVYYNGQQLMRGTHYTISGRTITFLITLQDGTKVSVTYIRT